MKFDNRTTSEVEATRSMVNSKPYRKADQRDLARRTAVLYKDGVYRTDAPVSYHKKAKE